MYFENSVGDVVINLPVSLRVSAGVRASWINGLDSVILKLLASGRISSKPNTLKMKIEVRITILKSLTLVKVISKNNMHKTNTMIREINGDLAVELNT